MITLRDVSQSDKNIYDLWPNDMKLTDYLSRLLPRDSSVENHDTLRVYWFIIEEDNHDIGAVWLEKDTEIPTLIETKLIEECAGLCKEFRFQFTELSMNMPQYQIENIGIKEFAEGAKNNGIYYTIH